MSDTNETADYVQLALDMARGILTSLSLGMATHDLSGEPITQEMLASWAEAARIGADVLGMIVPVRDDDAVTE